MKQQKVAKFKYRNNKKFPKSIVRNYHSQKTLRKTTICAVTPPWVKKQDTLLMSITSRNIDLFSKFFHC